MPAKKQTPKSEKIIKDTKAIIGKAEKQAKEVVGKAEKKIDDVKKTVKEEAKFVKEESKEIASGISKWWEVSSTEEKIYTILGIIALLWGLYVLKGMIWGLLLIIVGILFVTGYFIKKQ